MTKRILLSSFLVPLALLLAACPAAAAEEAGGDRGVADAVDQLSQAVQGAGWSLAPVMLASAWLVTLAAGRALAYRRNRLFPRQLREELELVAEGVRPDCEKLSRIAQKNPSPLANVVRSVLRTVGRPLANRRSAADDAIVIELSALRGANGWFDVLYSTATLFGLLAAVITLIESFSLAGSGTEEKAHLYTGIARALTATGAGVLLAILARPLGEFFRQRQEKVAAEFGRRVLPLVENMEEAGGGHAGKVLAGPTPSDPARHAESSANGKVPVAS